MNNDEKQMHLPASLLSTERGGRVFPKWELLPFIQKTATNVKSAVNEANFNPLSPIDVYRRHLDPMHL